MNGYQLDWLAVLTGEPRQWLLSGLVVTLLLSLTASLLATLLAAGLVALSLSPLRGFRWLAAGLVTLFRNTPLLVQLLFWYFGVLPLLPEPWREWLNLDHEWLGLNLLSAEFLAGVWGLGLFSAAFIAEEWQSGIRTLDRGQFEVSRSQGLSRWQSLRHVILPQALANSWQPLIGQYLNVMKNSTLAMSIAVAELCYQVNQVESFNLHAIEAYAIGAALYLLLGLVLSHLLSALGWQLCPHRRHHVHGGIR